MADEIGKRRDGYGARNVQAVADIKPDAVTIRFRAGEPLKCAMPIPFRADYDAARLRLAARESRDAGQTRRLLALAAIYDGATRSEAASIGGVTVQIVRD